LQPKSEKCIFVGYFEDVKGYRLLKPHCNEIIIIINVKFDENILSCEPNSSFLPSSTCNPSSTFVPSCFPILVYLDGESEDGKPPLLSHIPPNDSIEHEPAL
jgi:hypothetical protein